MGLSQPPSVLSLNLVGATQHSLHLSLGLNGKAGQTPKDMAVVIGSGAEVLSEPGPSQFICGVCVLRGVFHGPGPLPDLVPFATQTLPEKDTSAASRFDLTTQHVVNSDQ